VVPSRLLDLLGAWRDRDDLARGAGENLAGAGDVVTLDAPRGQSEQLV
jgi:hypothetical protein